MSRALPLLIALQLRGWLRYAGRNLRTVRGALFALIGGGMIALYLVAVLLTPRDDSRVDPDALRRNGPAFLLLYCLMNVLVYSGERAVYFSPAEINFLFGGPFGRRQVLGYKILSTFLIGLPSTLIFAVMVMVHAASFWTAYVGLLLVFLFLQLFGMAVNLLATSLGERLVRRGRWLAGAAALALAAVVIWQAAATPGSWDLKAMLSAATQTPAWHVAATPLRWFFEAFLAERLWPDLVVYASLGMLVNGVLLGVVFWLDADYQEAAAASSARIYAQIQRFRRGGVTAARVGGKARFGVPDLPYWGGVGPIFWRQLTTAVRGMGRLLLTLGIMTVFILGPLFAQGEAVEGGALGAVFSGIIVWMTVFVTQLVPFDFRGDVDRIATLKTLPIVPWRLTIGQLLAPVVVVTAVQWVLLAVVLATAPPDGWLLLAVAAFVLPFNFVLFGLENLLFLRFPARVMAATPGDFQAMGRNMLFALAKMAALTAILGAAALGGALTYGVTWALVHASGTVGWFARGWEPEAIGRLAWSVAGAASWLVLALAALILIPLVTWAYNAFDVGRDTPP